MIRKGWIYVASNPAMPGYLKIGMTQKLPEVRISELQTTGVPEPFNLEYSCLVPDAFFAESQIHRYFGANRENKDREFFRVSIDHVVAFIRESFDLENEVRSGTETKPIPKVLLDTSVPHTWRNGYLATLTAIEKLDEELDSLQAKVKPEPTWIDLASGRSQNFRIEELALKQKRERLVLQLRAFTSSQRLREFKERSELNDD